MPGGNGAQAQVPAEPPLHLEHSLVDRMVFALPKPVTLMQVASAASCASFAAAAAGMKLGKESLSVAALGLGAIGAASSLAMLFKETGAWRRIRREEEARRSEALRNPELANQPLAAVVGNLLERSGKTDLAAALVDWSAPGLFVDAMGNDVSSDVAHLLARAVDSANRMPPADGREVLLNLAVLVNRLAKTPDMRAKLADTVSEANGDCQDRLRVSLGQLMLADWMHECRAPDAPPDGVVLCAVMHASIRAATGFVHELLSLHADGAEALEPSSELMLHAYHAVEAGLRDFGFGLPNIFPPTEFVDPIDSPLCGVVDQWAERLTAGLVEPVSGQQAFNAGGVADLLMTHGGTDVEEIFSTRLAHLIEPAMEPLHRRDEQLQATQEQMPGGDFEAECRKLMQESRDVRKEIYKKAVQSADLDGGGVWRTPIPTPAPA